MNWLEKKYKGAATDFSFDEVVQMAISALQVPAPRLKPCYARFQNPGILRPTFKGATTKCSSALMLLASFIQGAAPRLKRWPRITILRHNWERASSACYSTCLKMRYAAFGL